MPYVESDDELDDELDDDDFSRWWCFGPLRSGEVVVSPKRCVSSIVQNQSPFVPHAARLPLCEFRYKNPEILCSI